MTENAVIVIAVMSAVVLFFVSFSIPDMLKNWRQAKADAANAALKQKMIERGFTAEEIAQVIAAGGSGDEATSKTSHPAKTG
jgi:uncharacterized membrane protein YadS